MASDGGAQIQGDPTSRGALLVLAAALLASCTAAPEPVVDRGELLVKAPATAHKRARTSLGDACPEMVRGRPRVPVDGLRFYASRPVAHVGARTIGAQAFNLEARKLDKIVKGLRHEDIKPYATQTLERVVTRCLVLRAIAESEEPSQDAVAEAMAAFHRRYDTEAKRDNFYRSAGLSAQEHRRELVLELRVRRHIEAIRPVVVPERDLRDYYKRERRNYAVGPRVTLRQLVIDLGDGTGDRIVEILRASKESKMSFEETIKTYSKGHNADQGGLYSEVPYSSLPKEVAIVARHLAPNTLSEPVLSDEGYHVIEVQTHHAAYIPSFETLRAQLEHQLREQLYRKARKRWLDDLRKGADIELHPEAVVIERRSRSCPGEACPAPDAG